jgi:hypothetical protein
VDVFSQGDDLRCIGRVARAWEVFGRVVECGERLETSMKSCWAVPFGKVGNEEFWRLDSLLERFLGVRQLLRRSSIRSS